VLTIGAFLVENFLYFPLSGRIWRTWRQEPRCLICSGPTLPTVYDVLGQRVEQYKTALTIDL
jgi:hypothetical protein